MGQIAAKYGIPGEVLLVGASAATEQFTEMKLGLRDHFSLESIIEQMVAELITAKIDPVASKADEVELQEEVKAADVVINTVMSGIVQEAFEGHMSAQAVEELAAQALGSEIGDAIGNEIDPPQQIQEPSRTQTPQAAPQENVFERALDEFEGEVKVLVDDIKDIFDPKLVAPGAQKPAPSIAKKLSKQGVFARKVVTNNDENDGIDLTLGSVESKLNSAQLGKGLSLSDENVDSNVNRAPTTITSRSTTASIISTLGDITMLSSVANALNSALHPVTTFENMTLPEMAEGVANLLFLGITDGGGEVVEAAAEPTLAKVSGEISDSGFSEIKQRVLANIETSKLSRPAVNNFRIHALTDQALFNLDASTLFDSSVAWSGTGNEELATEFALNTNKTTLEMTRGGQYLKSLDLMNGRYSYEQAVRPWEALSQRFAENASGKVYAFVEGSKSTSVFNRIEYPAFINNPNVTDIIFSPSVANIFKPGL